MAAKKEADAQNDGNEVYEMACIVDSCTMMELSVQLASDWRKLGRVMGLTDMDLECIKLDYTVDGTVEMAYQVMDKWKRLKGNRATNTSLARHLSKIRREDLVQQIVCKPEEDEMENSSSRRQDHLCIPPDELLALLSRKRSRTLLMNKLKTSLGKRYQKLLLKGLPWMQDLNITLDDYYVDLSMIQQDENGVDLPEKTIQINRIFKLLGAATRPSKMLIEGGPGYGKTTFACKLCHDYASKQHYLRRFDLVFLVPLRDFSGDLNELLIRASGVSEEEVDDLLSILKSKKSIKTLLILDGFDEIPAKSAEVLLPFLRGEIYPNLAVVVTSRPGLFTSETMRGGKGSFSSSYEINISDKPFDRRIKITGFNERMQQEFTTKHIAKLSFDEKSKVEQKLKKMKSSQVLSPTFLQCPLFLLMIILLLTEKDSKYAQNLETRTELYKEVLNYVIRRYLFKVGANATKSVNLYTFESTQMPFYVNLMLQFGQFSVEALKSDKLLFSRNEILDLDGNRDARIVDLGLLTQTLSVKGFRENVFLEPVHKSLMEFSAAYSVWVEFVTEPLSQWEKNVCSIRPEYANAPSSLIFYFLVGLMGKDVAALFSALRPYAAEYSYFFGSLQFSLLDIQMLPTILPSLLPFLPVEWRITWYQTNISQFSTSSAHIEILSFGLKKKKIKSVYWFLKYAAFFPDDMYVEKLALHIEHALAPLRYSRYNKIACEDLHCYFLSPSLSAKHWENFLTLLACIHYQRISFHFLQSSCSFVFPFLYEAVTIGSLRDITRINWMDCDLLESKSVLVKKVLDLIQNEKIGGLRLELCASPIEPTASDIKQGKDYQLLSQDLVDRLVSCASKSSQLKHFVLINGQEPKPTINLAKLSNDGLKSWSLIELDNVKVQCTQQIQHQNFQLQHLRIANSDLPPSVSKLMQSWCVTSLSCSYPFLLQEITSRVLYKHLTEMHIAVNKSVFQERFFDNLKKIEKLNILSLQMVSFDYQSLRLPVDKWLMGAGNVTISLKELQIRVVEKNPAFTKELLQAVIKNLNGTLHKSSFPEAKRYPSSTCYQPRKLELQTFSLQTNAHPDPISLSPADSADHFFALILALKQPLEKNILPQFDVITVSENFFHNTSLLKPGGFVSLSDTFPSEEGFIIEHDKWGMREDDSVWGKQNWEFNPPSYSRFSISYKSVKKNSQTS